MIHNIIQASIEAKQALLQRTDLIRNLDIVVDRMVEAYRTRDDAKILFCGNGGSAADAQHWAAELTGRFYFDRRPLNAEALHVDTSYLTAVANDYGYEQVFSRMVLAKGHEGDFLIGLSTSGNSPNVLRAMEAAREIGMITIAFTGEGGGQLKDKVDYLFDMPSKDTPRIQECHALLGHILCEAIESRLFKS